MTSIGWTQRPGTKGETWNPWTGCSIVSPGCTHCYAMRLAGTKLQNAAAYSGLTKTVKGNPIWTGELRLNKARLIQPLRWRDRRTVFVNSMSDLFHEAAPEEWIAAVFAVMALSPRHDFQILTKRAWRMRATLGDADFWRLVREHIDQILAQVSIGHKRGTKPDLDFAIRAGLGLHALPNVWLGVSVEDQRRADERIPELMITPAAVRFLSCEPLLERLDLRGLVTYCPEHDFESGFCVGRCPSRRKVDWIIAGGESGPKARPCSLDWFRDLRELCAIRRIPFFLKQLGGRGDKREACPLDGERHLSWPNPRDWRDRGERPRLSSWRWPDEIKLEGVL